MTSVVIIADSGAEMARLTATVHAAPGMVLVRHASGRAPVASIVADHQPMLVVLGEMSPRRLVLERLAEIRRVSPDSRIVVVAEDADAGWAAPSAPARPPSSRRPERRGARHGAPGGPRRRHRRRGAHAAGRVTRDEQQLSHTKEGSSEMRVLIVVDNALTAEAIRREMRHAPTCRVIGYVNGRRPCALAIADAAPDLVVIDDAEEEPRRCSASGRCRAPSAAKVVLLTARGRRAARGSSGRGHRLGDLQPRRPRASGS